MKKMELFFIYKKLIYIVPLLKTRNNHMCTVLSNKEYMSRS